MNSELSDTICVIGSNSFSGSHFLNYAKNSGFNVFGISRSIEPNQMFLPYKWNNEPQKIEFYQLDINHDMGKIKELLLAKSPNFIVNFAAQSMVAESWEHPEHWFQN